MPKRALSPEIVKLAAGDWPQKVVSFPGDKTPLKEEAEMRNQSAWRLPIRFDEPVMGAN